METLCTTLAPTRNVTHPLHDSLHTLHITSTKNSHGLPIAIRKLCLLPAKSRGTSSTPRTAEADGGAVGRVPTGGFGGTTGGKTGVRPFWGPCFFFSDPEDPPDPPEMALWASIFWAAPTAPAGATTLAGWVVAAMAVAVVAVTRSGSFRSPTYIGTAYWRSR